MSRRSFVRPSGRRDATLIVIACEGHRTEPDYFTALRDLMQTAPSRAHIEPLSRLPNDSSPEQVLNDMDTFRKKYALRADDQFWLVIDVDRWGDKKLSEVCSRANQKQYKLAVSNPCFELWLLLHHVSWNDMTEEKKEEIRTKTKDALSGMLKTYAGAYNPAKLDGTMFMPHVGKARIRAKQMDPSPADRWPQDIGTRVYKLIDAIEVLQPGVSKPDSYRTLNPNES